MQYRKLGRSDLNVSTLCLGSMTWGSQNTEAEGHAQIDRALDAGVNFIDVAEMYPANPRPGDQCGDTEKIIGDWFAGTGRRDDVILATKVSGQGMKRMRDGAPISSTTIHEALDGSLRRLQTDHVDLYQLHWPNRGSYHFRQNWDYDPTRQDTAEVMDHIRDVLTALQKEVDRGRIRHIGLSNESAWGVQQFLNVAEAEGLPRVVTVQNEYSLLCRHYDLDLAETSHHTGVDCLAFSPLACGILSGKYSGGAVPAGSRRSINETIGGRVTDRVWPAADAYLGIAREAGLDPCQMALAFCLSRPFMGAAIFGATNMAQLETALGAADMTLSDDVLAAIAAAHRAHPMPF